MTQSYNYTHIFKIFTNKTTYNLKNITRKNALCTMKRSYIKAGFAAQKDNKVSFAHFSHLLMEDKVIQSVQATQIFYTTEIIFLQILFEKTSHFK